jgi:hypothetical protein
MVIVRACSTNGAIALSSVFGRTANRKKQKKPKKEVHPQCGYFSA